jgi:hypothetical protein
MKYKYSCKLCNFDTNKKFDYNRHLETRKHIRRVSKGNLNKSAQFYTNPSTKQHKKSDKNKLYFKCEYCKNEYKKANKARHLRTCKAKKDEVKILKQTINNINNTNNITNNDNRQLNMYYVINNYKEASNYSDLMDKPLTKEELDYLFENGPTLGCLNLIKSRCLNDLEKDKRPFHCVDGSRDKYLLREEDNWSIDLKGEKIMNKAMNTTRDNYKYDLGELGDAMIKMGELLKLEQNGKKKILKDIKKKSLLKNQDIN